MKDLIYITGNEYKLYTARKFLNSYEINVIGKKIECPEIQADNIEDVAKYSAEYACSKLNCSVLKNDMGLIIPALNGFPAAYTHYVEDTLGDIIISIQRVKEQAEEYGHSFERELAYMLVHGFYHLMGEDHMEEDEKACMREKEEKVLSILNITRD